MDQPNPVPIQQNGSKPNEKLPHLVVEEPKRGIFGTLGIIVLSVTLLGIPIGIFLVSQRTQLIPQAAVIEEVSEVIPGIFLESKLSPESAGGIIPVDVYVKSEINEINLVNAQISFEESLIGVEKIATEGAQLTKWVEASFDNTKGNISLISGVPNPGIKTAGQTGEKVYLATLHLKPKKTGTAILQVTSDSQILRNSDNNNIFRTGNDLALSLTSATPEATSSARPAKESKKAAQEPLIVITSPVSAANYSYFKTVNINWSSFNVSRISKINLYVNDELLGPISQNLDAQDGQFLWNTEDTLALPYIQLSNIFRIELIGMSEEGEVAKILSGPFGILGTEEVIGSPPNPEVFSQNQLNVSDVSMALTNYLVLPLKEKSLDLNKDEVINELDLFLIRQNLLMRGVIK